MNFTLRATAVAIALTVGNPLSVAGASTEAEPASSPYGIAWGCLYNDLGSQAHPFLSFLPDHGAGLSHVILFRPQIESGKGQFESSAPTAFSNELNRPDEGISPGIMGHCR